MNGFIRATQREVVALSSGRWGGLRSEGFAFQLITPTPSQTGPFVPVLWARMGRLHIYLPPWPNLIASKLARGDERDVEDVLFLAGKHRVTAEAVGTCAAAMPAPARQQVLENLEALAMQEG